MAKLAARNRVEIALRVRETHHRRPTTGQTRSARQPGYTRDQHIRDQSPLAHAKPYGVHRELVLGCSAGRSLGGNAPTRCGRRPASLTG